MQRGKEAKINLAQWSSPGFSAGDSLEHGFFKNDKVFNVISKRLLH
jgi:hypothetical protein